MCIVFIIIELILFVGRVTLVGRTRLKKNDYNDDKILVRDRYDINM